MKSIRNSSRAPKAGPSFEPTRNDASYVAWLFRINPPEIFAIIPECSTEGDQQLVDCILAKLFHLNEQAARSPDRSPRALWFRRTLAHCNDVMEGRCKSPSNNGSGFDNVGGYRRGIYLFKEVEQ